MIQAADSFADTKSVTTPVEKDVPAAFESEAISEKEARKQAKKEAKAAAKAQKAAKRAAASDEKKENPFTSFFAGLKKKNPT